MNKTLITRQQSYSATLLLLVAYRTKAPTIINACVMQFNIYYLHSGSNRAYIIIRREHSYLSGTELIHIQNQNGRNGCAKLNKI